MSLQATTWQTVGPYFRIGLEHLNNAQLASATAPGERVTIQGRVWMGKASRFRTRSSKYGRRR